MYGGFDRDSYDVLGDTVMGAIRGHTNLRWVGFYLAHSAVATGSTWTARRNRSPQVSTWRFLRSEGWGIAPIFLARQFVTDAAGRSAPNPNWTEANGNLDGQHAVALANADTAANLVDIERGATIYLDLEADGFASVPAAQNYMRGWFDAVRGAGYRPGVYCFNTHPSVHPSWPSDGGRIRALFPDVAVWFIRLPNPQPPVFDEGSGWLRVLDVTNFHDADDSLPTFGFVASQFAWYNQNRAIQGARLRTGPTSFHNLGAIDFDASRLPDPAHPEDVAALAFTRFKSGTAAVVWLRPDYAAWQYNDGDWGQWGQAVALSANTPIADKGYGRWFDTRSVAAASRQPELVDMFGIGIDGSVWTNWRSPDHDGVDGEWTTGGQLVSPTGAARHGSAVAAVSRKTDVLDVFYVNPSHELATTWWTPADGDWLSHNGAITHGFAFAPATSIAAVTAPHDGERLDLFAIDWTNVPRWVQWRHPGPWREVQVPLPGPADPALGAQAAWFGGNLHLVVGLRDGSLVHLSHPDGVLETPWTLRGVLPGLGTLVRPMGFALAALDAALVAVVVGSNQTLFWASFENGAWGVPGLDNATPPYSASGRIAAHRFDGSSVDVVLPNHAGSVVMRRLVRTPVPLAPLSLSRSWELIL